MNRDEARKALFDALENEVVLSNQKYIQKVEEDARNFAKERAISYCSYCYAAVHR